MSTLRYTLFHKLKNSKKSTSHKDITKIQMTLNATHFSISSFLDSPMHIVVRWLYGVRHCLLEGRYS